MQNNDGKFMPKTLQQEYGPNKIKVRKAAKCIVVIKYLFEGKSALIACAQGFNQIQLEAPGWR